MGAVLAIASLSAVATSLAAAPAHAQEQSYDFNIPAQSLEAALVQFADKTGVQLAYTAELARGLRSPGVQGRMGAQAALTRLLSGTGLTFRVTASGAMTIERSLQAAEGAAEGERVLGPVRVEGTRGNDGQRYDGSPVRGEGVAQLGGIRGGQAQEVEGLRAKVVTVGGASPVPIEDLPRSVSVLTQEQIEKQDVTDIGRALNRLPGVTVVEGSGNTGDAGVYSRGLEISRVQVDGGVTRDLDLIGNGALNLAPYERVELLRGSNGAYAGMGSFGGTINLVRKRPGADEMLDVKLAAGSWERAELTADWSTPSVFGSPVAFRTVESFRTTNASYDNFNQKDYLTYGIFDAPLGDAARIEFGWRYAKVDVDGAYSGLLRYANGQLIPTSHDFNYAPSFSYRRTETIEGFSRLYARLLRDWNIEFGVSYQDQSTHSLGTSFSQIFYPDGRAYANSYATVNEYVAKPQDLGVDLRLTGKFDTFFLEHHVFASATYNDRGGGTPSGYSRSVSRPISSIADIQPGAWPTPSLPTFAAIPDALSTSDTAIAFGDTISWKDIAEATITLSKYDYRMLGYSVLTDPQTGTPYFFSLNGLPPSQKSGGFLPSYSGALHPLKGLTLFGSYSSGFSPNPDSYTRDGSPLPPTKFNSLEAGVKYGTRNWLASATYYKGRQTGFPAAIPGSEGQCPPTPISPCYDAQGATQRTEGVDVEFSGQLFQGLSLTASYNYNKNETISTGLPLLTASPASEAKFFAEWTPSFLPKANFQLGATYRDKVYYDGFVYQFDGTGQITGSTPTHFDQPAYLVFDVGAEYQLSKRLAIGLRVENVTDKFYFSTVGPASGNYVGRPRSFMINLHWLDKKGDHDTSPTTGLAPFGDPADWYAALDIGWHMPGDYAAKASGVRSDGSTPVEWGFGTQDSPTAFVRLGYHLSDNFRVELEGGYRTSAFGRIQGGTVAPTGVCDAYQSNFNGAPFNCDDAPGGSRTWSLMANMAYDFGKRDAPFRPFIGVGAGLARTTVEFTGKLRGVGSDNIDDFELFPGFWYVNEDLLLGSVDTSVSPAVQGIAGASVRLSNRVSADLSYRYFYVPTVKWDSFNLSTSTPRVGEFKSDMRDHAFTIGLRWAFGSK